MCALEVVNVVRGLVQLFVVAVLAIVFLWLAPLIHSSLLLSQDGGVDAWNGRDLRRCTRTTAASSGMDGNYGVTLQEGLKRKTSAKVSISPFILHSPRFSRLGLVARLDSVGRCQVHGARQGHVGLKIAGHL